jgi:ATP-dependent DNA helicase RecG
LLDPFAPTEDRLTFLIHIPVHAGSGNQTVFGTDEEETPVTTEKTTEKIVRLMVLESMLRVIMQNKL